MDAPATAVGQGGRWLPLGHLRHEPLFRCTQFIARDPPLFTCRPCVSQSRRARMREPETSMSTTNGGPEPQTAMPQVGVLAQYVKDFSFENPHAPRSLAPSGQQPPINIQ